MFSQGLSIFQNASHFTVNVLGASQQALAQQIREILGRQIRRGRMDAGPRQRAGSRRQRRQFPVPRGQSLLWRRPRHLPRRGRGLCLQPAGAAVVCARRLTAGFSSLTTTSGPAARHERKALPKRIRRQAEAAFAGRSPQGVRRQGDRILRRRRLWRRHPRSGAPARRHPAAVVSLLSEQGRSDQGSLSHGLSRAARYRLGEAVVRPLAPDSRPAAGILSSLYGGDLHPQMASHLSLLGPEGARHQPLVCRRGPGQDSDAHHPGMPP